MNDHTGVQLVLVPGLGADYRMFAPQADAFPGLVVPPWIVPERGESLASCATRLAGTVQLRPGVPLVLGGVSLGGMIAYEMARHLRPAAVVLVASCRSGEALAQYRPLRPLARRLPVAAVKLAQFVSPAAIRLFRPRALKSGRLAADMFREIDPRFIRWALSALLDWRPESEPAARIFQIHGGRDRVIPVDRNQSDAVIPSGGHLINLTHADRVNAFIASILEKVAS